MDCDAIGQRLRPPGFLAKVFTKVVHPGATGDSMGNRDLKSTRASLTFPKEQYAMLEKLAAQKQVSIAWLVRRAVERYLGSQWPLLAPEDTQEDGFRDDGHA